MAVVGDAYVIVRALTDKVDGDIRRGFRGADRIGRQAGESMGDAFARGFSKKSGKNVFSRFADGIAAGIPDAEQARLVYARLTRTLLSVGPAVSVLIGGIGSLVGGLGALVGSAGAAVTSLTALGNVFVGVRIGFASAKLALSGVSDALKALNKESGGGAVADNTEQIEEAQRRLALVIEENRERLAEANSRVEESQIALNEALEEGREELQQIGFEAEDAALAEERAALELERARETLARTQDLPPNSRVRREAELAFKEAEFNYRVAKDRASDLNDEQERLARTGVAGTDVVISAVERLAEAEANKARVVRDGIRAQEDAEKALEDLLKAGKGGGGGSDPFAGLNKFQVDFVKFLNSLKPLYDELKLAASEAFLVPLQEAITLLAERAFPTLKQGITDVSAAMGQASISIALAVTQAENLNDLARVFSSSAAIIRSFGRTLGNVWDIALSLLAAASPLAIRFVNFLDERSNSLASFLDVKQATGELEAFFDRAGDIAADWGTILGNVFGGIGQLVQANFAPGSGGDYLVQWLIDATGKFKNLDETAGGSDNLSEYFLGASVNTQKILSSIGALITEIIKLGDNPAIGETFDILAEGAPAVGEILEKLIEAGPAMAELVVGFTEFAASLTDSLSAVIFFETLRTALDVVNALLSNDLIKNIVIAVSQVGALALALGTITTAGKFAFKAIVGSVAFFSGAIGTAIGKTRTLILALGTKTTVAAQAARTALLGMMGAAGKAVGLVAVFSGVASAIGGMTREAELSESAFTNFDESIKGISNANFDEIFQKASIDTYGKSINTTATELEYLNSWQKTALIGLTNFTNGITFGAIPALSEAAEALTFTEDMLFSFGEALSEVATVNLGQAQIAFQDMAANTDGSNEALLNLFNEMPQFKEELRTLAEANGLATDENSLLEIAMGRSTAAGKILEDQYNNTSAATLDTSGKIQDLADAVRDFTDDGISAERAAIRFEEQMDDVAEALENNEKGMDINTEAGQRNRTAILDAAEALNDMTVANYENGGSTAKLRSDLNSQRAELVKMAEQFGMSEDEAKEYIDTLVMTPGELNSLINLNGVPKSKEDIEGVQEKAEGLAGTPTSPRYWDARLSASKDTQSFSWWDDLRNQLNQSYTVRYNAYGTYTGRANGMIQSYANGGIAPGVYAGRTGSMFKMAEPDLGWEAFISGKPGQRQRNIKIWQEVGKRLGVELMPNAVGRMYSQVSSVMASNVDSPYQTTANARSFNQNYNNIVITVNPAEKIDKSELSSSISKEISFQMRKGSVT